MIIGLTGSIAAGKGVVSDFLKDKGFVYLSLSNELREIARKRKIEITRVNLQDLGNSLRREFSPSVLANTVIEKINKQALEKVIVDGIRNPSEIKELKKLKNFFLVSVDAPIEQRFQRCVDRNRESDPISYMDFLSIDERDKGMGEDLLTGQGVARCMSEADFTFTNSGTLDDAKKDIDILFDKINDSIPRPSWDEYFSDISKAVAKRATCNRGKAGCVIVKNKHILVSGYVGSPNGLPHCDEVGHQMESTIHEDGVEREHCIRTTHAEQNAICQAAKLGISIDGATIYCKMEPCSVCAKIIINSGIRRVVCEKRYQSGAQSLLEEGGVLVDVLNEEVEGY